MIYLKGFIKVIQDYSVLFQFFKTIETIKNNRVFKMNYTSF
jgi:hypothetical protein